MAMFRLDAGLITAGATTAVAFFLLAAPLDGPAYAQPGRGKPAQGPSMPSGPAARPAPPSRPAMPPPAAMRQAPPPAAMRAAPQPRFSRPAPQPKIARPPMRPPPQMQRPERAPRLAAPPRPTSPRVASPTRRSAPAVQRAAPPPKAASRPDVERPAGQSVRPRIDREQTRSERLTRSDQRELRRLERDARPKEATEQRLQGLRTRSESGRLSRKEQGELRRLERREQQQKSPAERLQQLQARSESGRLSGKEQGELRRLERREQLQKSAAQRMEQLQSRAQTGKLDRAGQRELRQLERQQRALGIEQRQQVREATTSQGEKLARVTPQQVAAGRFAANFEARKEDRRGDWRSRRHAPRAAWRLGLHARYVPWVSAVYWPYAYADVFYYTFWPEVYEEGYWAYAYDDFFDGIYFPYGAPHVDYAYAGPYGAVGEGVTTASVPSRQGTRQRVAPGRMSQEVRALCTEPDEGITAWPIAEIAEAVQPSSEQTRLLDDLKKAADAAAAEFREACPESLPMTPPGRLQAMSMRLQATLDALKTVRPALEAFYASLSDEQKARFNEIRPKLRQGTAAARTQDQGAECGGEKAGLSALPIEEIERVVRPTGAQTTALDRLDEATQQAVGVLNAACPTSTPATPVGRLEVMQQRLEAMIEAANSVRPALQDFYAALSDEQKAKFNRLGRDSARRG
jgi:hypothetical protein